MRAIGVIGLLQCLAVGQPAGSWGALFRNSTVRASAVDGEGNFYVAGSTLSANLPVTPNALGPVFISAVCGYFQGPHGTQGPPRPCEHGFAAKIDPTGTRVLYATYIGGEQQDGVTDLALDTEGNVFLIGNSSSKTFPVTPGAQTTGPGFLLKLDRNGSRALFSTRLSGTVGGFARAGDGTLYITGFTSEDSLPRQPYLLKVTDGGSAILRMPVGDSFTAPQKVDEQGNLYFASSGAVLDDLGEVYISKRDKEGRLIYSFSFGGSGADYITAIDVGDDGAVYFTVYSKSWNFPRTAGPATWSDGATYIAKLSPDGSRLIYSTLISYGQSFFTLKAGEDGRAFVSGRLYGKQLVFGSSADPDCYPFLGGENDFSWSSFVGELSADGGKFRFVTGLSSSGIPFVNSQGRYWTPGRHQLLEIDNPFDPGKGIRCINNSASKRKGPIAPGQLITLHGDGIEGAAVYINGVLAPVLDTSASRIDAVVPFRLDTQSPATIQLVGAGNVDFPEFIVPIAEASPGAYSRDGSGQGLLALWNEDGSPNSAESPALSGTIARFYVTGLGAVDPTPQDGAVSNEKYATKTRLSPKVRFANGLWGNHQAEVIYCGSAPGKVEGITQIEVRIPAIVHGDEPYFLQLDAGLAELSNNPGVQVYLKTR